MSILRAPCSYQGCKQRIAKEVVPYLVGAAQSGAAETMYYDLCSGSGAITLELINQGVLPDRITMLDKSSWGVFWAQIGNGEFDLDRFRFFLDLIPDDKSKIKAFVSELAMRDIGADEPYLYLILQSCSFGGKQITRSGEGWRNAFFRDYWEPTPTSVRRSPANPMQPSKETLYKRVASIAANCVGLRVVADDITSLFDAPIQNAAVFYLDPPYRNTTGYLFGFDVDGFVDELKRRTAAPLFVSEAVPLSPDAVRLDFKGAKGGISGTKPRKHPEWLSRF